MAENETPTTDQVAAPAEGDSGRYAAYDKTLGRFVGGVRDTRKDADEVAKGIRDAGRKAEVRQV